LSLQPGRSPGYRCSGPGLMFTSIQAMSMTGLCHPGQLSTAMPTSPMCCRTRAAWPRCMTWNGLWGPKISSAQLMPHAGTHGALRRANRAVVREDWRFGQGPPAARAVAGAAGRSRCPDAAGAHGRTARTLVMRAMHPAIPPPGILADQAQHQDADRAHSPWPARAPGRDRRACRRPSTSRWRNRPTAPSEQSYRGNLCRRHSLTKIAEHLARHMHLTFSCIFLVFGKPYPQNYPL
jgi:hypothetical protein